MQGKPPPTTTAREAAVARALAADLIEPCEAVLARVWLVGPGDQCVTCPMRDECPERTRCLHLVASVGVTTRTDGPFRRFPIGARRVGQVASTRQPFIATTDLAASGLAEPAWLATHAVRSFAAFPLALGQELIGVLALFSRRTFAEPEARALAVAARHAASAIAAARQLEVQGPARRPRSPGARVRVPEPAVERGAPDLRPLADIEREAIERVLAHTGGRVSGPQGAAKILGLKPTTLASRMLKLGVRRKPRTPPATL